jgi:hypothetical protein
VWRLFYINREGQAQAPAPAPAPPENNTLPLPPQANLFRVDNNSNKPSSSPATRRKISASAEQRPVKRRNTVSRAKKATRSATVQRDVQNGRQLEEGGGGGGGGGSGGGMVVE